MTDTNHIEVLRKVIHWAESRCPCKEETPDPCTLCGATVAEGTCKAVESIFPRDLLRDLRDALSARASAGEGVSRLMLAVIGRKHFGNPIPQEWYAAARELLAAAPQPAQAGASGGGENYAMVAIRAGERAALRAAMNGGTPASPATEQGGVSVESVRRALASYHLQFTEHDEDGPQSLFDALTPPGDVDIGRGIKELGLLADYVAAELSTPQPAAAPQAHPAQGERKCRFCGCKETPERAADPYTTDGTVEVCPQCNEGESYVTECRHLAEYVAGVLTCTRCGFKWTTPPAHGDGEGDYAAKWFAECRRVLEDVSTEMHATGRGDTRFRRLIESMPRQRTTRPTPEARDCTCPSGDGSLRWPCPKHPPVDANVAAVQRKLGNRSVVGLRKYGVSTERGDLSHADWLRHLQEELMDAAVYVEAALALPAQGEGNNG